MTPSRWRSAAVEGLMACEICRLLVRRQKDADGLYCPRCGAPLNGRKKDSLIKTGAFIGAAAVLYIPANLLPIMITSKFSSEESNTIFSGVVSLWTDGSPPIAIFVFFVSILVPLLKLIALSFLVISTVRHSNWRLPERTKLYRFLEFIGRWSMLDVFVVALLSALVQIHQFASVRAGPGLIAFAAVVVLTMAASLTFDPRLMWDHLSPRGSTAHE